MNIEQNVLESQCLDSNNEPVPISEPGKMSDSSYEQNLRRSIISIHNDSFLTSAQKAKMIQVSIIIKI